MNKIIIFLFILYQKQYQNKTLSNILNKIYFKIPYFLQNLVVDSDQILLVVDQGQILLVDY